MSDKSDIIFKTLVDFRIESNERMGRIEDDLKEHKEGVMQNRARIEVLEGPRKALDQIKKWAMWIIPVAAAVGILIGAFS